ncbi:MAG: hypothetical protein ABUK01_08785 [Leptospirales bacterium]
MDSFELEIKDDGIFLARGKLSRKDQQSHSLSELIQKAVQWNGKVAACYDKALLNDNKLIGQEKVTILKSLISLHQVLVSMRLYLHMKNHPKDIVSAFSLDHDYNYKIYQEGYKYTISGKLSEIRLSQFSEFKLWKKEYDKIFQALLAEIRSSLSDSELSYEEIEKFNLLIDRLIILVIMIHWRLHSDYLDS